MSEPSGTGEASDRQQEQPKIEPSAASAEQKQPNENTDTNANKGNRKNGGGRKYLHELWKVGPDRHIELLLTIAIATFACFQLVITCSNNKSTSDQMNKLLIATDRINDAADSFSGSAAHINEGVQGAVDKLQGQIGQIVEANKIAHQAIEAQTRLG